METKATTANLELRPQKPCPDLGSRAKYRAQGERFRGLRSEDAGQHCACLTCERQPMANQGTPAAFSAKKSALQEPPAGFLANKETLHEKKQKERRKTNRITSTLSAQYFRWRRSKNRQEQAPEVSAWLFNPTHGSE